MKRKQLIAVILLLAMMMAIFAGCSQKAETKTAEPAASEKTETAPEESAETEEERYVIDFLAFGVPEYQDTFEGGANESPVYQDIVEKTNTELKMTSLDDNQSQIRIAGNDLGDLVAVLDASMLTNMVESDLLMPLNDLIEEYAPEIKETMPELWEKACHLVENDDNYAYCLPVNMGSEGHNANYVARYFYTVRWDLYKQLGCPELKKPEDLIQVHKDMMALEPTNDEGKTVYGDSFYLSDTSYSGLVNQYAATYGWRNIKKWYVWTNVQTNEPIYDMTYTDGPFWNAVEYYNNAYRAGTLDPDCFTQQAEDFDTRIHSGELICAPFLRDKGYEAAQLEKDPASNKGFVNIPVEGCMYYANTFQPAGWVAEQSLAIPKTCKNVEAVMRLIKYLYSEEGCRTIQSGVQGVHWDYDENGVPKFTDEAFEILTAGGDEPTKAGIRATCFECMSGWGAAQPLSDGYPASLMKGDDYFSRLPYSPATTECAEWLGVDYPVQKFEQLREEGKMYDLSGTDYGVDLHAFDEDIERIDATCLKIAIQAVPKLVMAESAEAFEAIKAETLTALNEAGAAQAEEYYVNAWKEACAK